MDEVDVLAASTVLEGGEGDGEVDSIWKGLLL